MKKRFKPAIVIVMAVIILQTCLPAAAGASSDSADFTVGDYDSLVGVIARQYILRDSHFTVKYNASVSEVKNRLRQDGPVWDDVFSVDIPGTTADLDYLHNNMKTMRISWQHNGTYAICEFTQTYLTTSDQEKYVSSAVGAALEALDIDGSSMYGVVSAIHSYIIETVDYDAGLSRFTAYDALYAHSAVCQGYALVMYRMLMEAGVPARIIRGEADNGVTRGPHAWNLAKIGPYWYNVDVTWDDSFDTAKYLLKNDAGFSKHYRDSGYAGTSFTTAHPMSPYNFDPSRDVKPVRSIALSPDKGTQYAVGDVFILSAVITPADATDKTLSWSSSHPGVASIDSAGRVTVKGPGTAVITATAADGTGKSADFILTAYVPDTPSAWAANDISALNARGVVPPELNTRYKADITRAEFVALIASVFKYAKGSDYPPGGILFADITTSPYKDQIALCHQLGIIDGKGDNLFAPDDTLTRQECAKIVGNAVKAINSTEVYSDAALRYADASRIAAWALPYVRYAYQTGLMQGADGCFNPQGVLSREQAMTVLGRMIVKYEW